MIAVDTNILVYAHRKDSPFHTQASNRIKELAKGPWCIPWPCIHEFLAIVTHPKIFLPPSSLAEAILAVESFCKAPTVRLLGETQGYLETLVQVLKESLVVGPRIHDARIYAVCLHHAVDELWTADRDFGRFKGLRVTNPLV